ncbi:hypothetical protein GZ245_000376 [Listeria monocytogenes]|nr:hypothetical protein [Listeria monocytogenes]EDO1375210.1 hypothetical protein [Listeria monocytogenes]
MIQFRFIMVAEVLREFGRKSVIFLRNQKALTKEEEKYCIKQPEKW